MLAETSERHASEGVPDTLTAEQIAESDAAVEERYFRNFLAAERRLAAGEFAHLPDVTFVAVNAHDGLLGHAATRAELFPLVARKLRPSAGLVIFRLRQIDVAVAKPARRQSY